MFYLLFRFKPTLCYQYNNEYNNDILKLRKKGIYGAHKIIPER